MRKIPMKTFTLQKTRVGLLLLSMFLAVLASAFPGSARAAVLPASTCAEISGTRTCDLWAKAGTLTLPGSVTVNIWGYAADSASPAGLPGPMLIANAGETLVINLHNGLSEATSLSIPGLPGPSDIAGVAGGGSKTYTYSGLQAGTYIYQAGPAANGERQVAMGMYGVLIVRPAGSPLQAYGPASTFDDEAVLVMSEIDPLLNASPLTYDMRNYTPRYFLFNGKAYPNTDAIDTAPGHTVLLRLVNAGVQSRSLGVLGLRQSVISMDGRAFSKPHFVSAETLGAGQTADVLIGIPASAAANQKYAVYDSSLRLINNSARFGGMLTFIQVTGTPGSSDMTGPTGSGLLLAPNPSNGSGLITFNATISDSTTGGSNVDQAEYFIDTIGVSGTGTALNASDSTFDSVTEAVTALIDPSSLSSGSHNVYIHGHDAAGNWGAVTSISLILDKAGPSTTGLSGNPNPTLGTVSVAISGTANDSASGNSNVTNAEFFIDTVGADGSGTALTLNQTAPIVSITGTISAVTMSGLSEGNHWVYAHSQDAYGNWGSFSSLQLKVDKTGPDTNSLQLRPNPNNGALPYSPSFQSIRLDATFIEPGAGLITSNVVNAEFFIDTVGANGTGILITPSDGSFNSASENGYSYIPLLTVNTLTDGNHIVSVHAKDAVGNWGPFRTITLVIDRAAPTVSLATLNPSASNNSAVVVSATGNDTATGNSNIGSGEYFIDTAGAAGTGTAMTPTSASPTATITATIPAATVGALTAGNHTVYIRARDVAGNWSSNTTSGVLLIDRTSPTITGISLVPNSIPVGTASVTLNVNGATDPLVGGLASGLNGGEYWFGTTNPAPGAGTPFSSTSTSIPTSSLTAGTYTVRTRMRDVAGNWSAFGSAALTVTPPPTPVYFSTFGNALPPGVGTPADDADIYFWSGSAFSRVIDASVAPYSLPASGTGNANVDGFDRVDATHFYMSFTGQVNVPGIGNVQDEDVVYYNAGTWSLYFDGSVNGVGGTDLDAISVVGGSLYFSTDNTTIPPGAGGTGDDADIYRWNGGSSYTRIYDASVLGWSTANVDGFVRVDATHFYVSYSADTTVPGLGTVQDEDVAYYNNGTWSVYFDGTSAGLTSGDLDIDAFDLP